MSYIQASSSFSSSSTSSSPVTTTKPLLSKLLSFNKRQESDSASTIIPMYTIRKVTGDIVQNELEMIQEKDCQDIQVLELKACDFQQKDQHVLLQALLEDTSQLKGIRFQNCTLSDDSLAICCQLLQKNQVLEDVHFVSCAQLSMTSLISLCSLLSSQATTSSLVSTLTSRPIQTLELSNCKLARQAGIILGQSLQHCKRLKRLILFDNNLRDGGVRAITDALKNARESSSSNSSNSSNRSSNNGGGESPVKLEVLDFSRNGLSSVGFSYLSSLQIEKVHVAGNSIGSGIGPFLLSTCQSLIELDISHNPLTEKGFQEIFKMFNNMSSNSTTLKILKLNNCKLKAQDAFFLKQMLTTWTSCGLEELWLGEQEKEENTKDNSEGVCTMDRRILLEDIRSMAQIKFPNLQIVLCGASPSGSTPTTNESSPLVKSQRDNAMSNSMRRKSSFGIKVRMSASSSSSSSSLSSPYSNKHIQIQKHMSKSSTSTITSTRQTDEEEEEEEEEKEVHEFTEQEFDEQGISSNGLLVMTTEKRPSHGLITSTNVMSSSSSEEENMGLSSGGLLNHEQVEYIVTKTIENMNSNFEKRLQDFVTQMETAQQLHNTSQLQLLTARVETIERAIPRMEARLDILSDRVTAGSAQFLKLSNDLNLQVHQMKSYHASPSSMDQMNFQIEELGAKIRASDQFIRTELSQIHKRIQQQPINSQQQIEQVKQEMEANQTKFLRTFTENIIQDSIKVEKKVLQVEQKVYDLEKIIQQEQHASLLALEAISEAMGGGAMRNY